MISSWVGFGHLVKGFRALSQGKLLPANFPPGWLPHGQWPPEDSCPWRIANTFLSFFGTISILNGKQN